MRGAIAWGIALLTLAGIAASPCVAQESASAIPIRIEKPDGDGPFPAVVMLHDCSGLGPRSSGAPARWAKVLLAEGYVVAFPDSFSTRGFPNGVCTDPSPERVNVGPLRRVPDADAALALLRKQPFVDAKRIGVMGGSHGGAATLATLRQRPGNEFVAGVALYPSCSRMVAGYHAAGPLLILTGELDDWTPAAPCKRLAENASPSGAPVSIKVYPGAHHSFDSGNPVRFIAGRVNENAPGGRGATTGGNAEAWADAIEQVKAFFARTLKAPAAAPAPTR